jgi:hypothetical protein
VCGRSRARGLDNLTPCDHVITQQEVDEVAETTAARAGPDGLLLMDPDLTMCNFSKSE